MKIKIKTIKIEKKKQQTFNAKLEELKRNKKKK
jgi:hypothetical protein